MSEFGEHFQRISDRRASDHSLHKSATEPHSEDTPIAKFQNADVVKTFQNTARCFEQSEIYLPAIDTSSFQLLCLYIFPIYFPLGDD